MSGRLSNKTIVISGGTKGIGRLLAKECAKQDGNVVIGGRDEAGAMAILTEIRGQRHNGIFVSTELRDITDCRKFDTVIDINAKAAFFCVQNAIRCMRQGGGGSIVLVGSAHSWGGNKDRAAYAVSKGALYTLSEHVAHNYAAEHIRCNFVTMGWTPTEGELALRKAQGMSERDLRDKAAGILPMGRMLTPEDHIPAFMYLLSDDSTMVTGANIRVTAGEYI